MRRVEISGGVELGPQPGPWIDIIPVRPGRVVTVEEAARTVCSAPVWYRWPPLGTLVHPATRDMKGVICVGGELSVRFLYHPDSDPLSALQQIERAEGGLHPALAGAVLSAATARRFPLSIGPSVIAASCSVRPAEGISTLNREEIERLARAYILSCASGEDLPMPSGGAVDRARFWMAVARMLWNPALRARFRFPVSRLSDPSTTTTVLSLGVLAAAHLDLEDIRHLQVAGGDMPVSDPPADPWGQVIEIENHNIPLDALRFLLPRGISSIRTAMSIPADVLLQIPADRQPLLPPPPDPVLASRLTAALVEEAERQGVYIPHGGFVLNLPEGYPLRFWGVSALRIWAHPRGLWVAEVNDKGEVGVCFGWRPGEPLSPWVLNRAVQPLVEATLAALWRDLRVAGEEGVPARGDLPRREKGTTAKGGRKRTSVRVLPSRRYIKLSGQRTWGTREDQEKIQRQSHAVRGHLRHLPEGWQPSEEARQTAVDFGIVLPPGYTFVRPYVRGGGSDPSGEATTIIARGLASVAILLQPP